MQILEKETDPWLADHTDRARGRASKRPDAYELLAPVYGWFTEGFDTKDLQEAKALLVELG